MNHNARVIADCLMEKMRKDFVYTIRQSDGWYEIMLSNLDLNLHYLIKEDCDIVTDEFRRGIEDYFMKFGIRRGD